MGWPTRTAGSDRGGRSGATHAARDVPMDELEKGERRALRRCSHDRSPRPRTECTSESTSSAGMEPAHRRGSSRRSDLVGTPGTARGCTVRQRKAAVTSADLRVSPRPADAIARGLCRRCPACGSRGTFESWYVRRERCPTCAFPTTRVQDQWIGAYGMNIIVSFTILVLAIAAGFTVTYPDPPIVSLTVICVVIAVGFPVVFQPISWSLWSGIDVAMRPIEHSDRVVPSLQDPKPRAPDNARRSSTTTQSRTAPVDPSFMALDVRGWDRPVTEDRPASARSGPSSLS